MNTTTNRNARTVEVQASQIGPLEKATPSISQPATRVKKLTHRKPPYRPSIRIVDFAAGCFLVSSRSQAGHWHEVTVPTSGCTCPASARGLMCRHIALCEAYQTAIVASRRQRVTPTPKPAPVANAMQTCDICGTQYWGRPATHWCACQQSVTPAPISITRKRDGAAGLMEAFS